LAQSAALTNNTAASDCQTQSGQIPGDEPEKGKDGYGGKTDKRKVSRPESKTP